MTSFLDRLKGAFGGGERKGITFERTGVQRLSPYPTTEMGSLVEARRRNELVFACINIRADAAQDPRLIVEQRNGDGTWEEAVGHPFRRLMMRPNPKMDEASFMAACIKSMDAAGVLYCEIVRSPAGQPVQLWPLDPSRVRTVYRHNADGTKEADHYEWRDGAARKRIEAADMLVREDWEMGGRLSRIAVALGSLDADNAQTDYIRSFFGNAGVPAGILKLKGSVSLEKAHETQTRWRARYGRDWGNQHNIAVLDDNADYQEIGSPLDRISSPELRQWAESRLCMVFGVPPLIIYAYVGLLRATYSNLDEAWKQFWLTTMSSLLKEWRAFFTLRLLMEFEPEERVLGEMVRLRWDLSKVAALQEDEDACHQRAERGFRAGATSLDEYRASLGLDPWPDGDIGAMNPYLLRLLNGAGPIQDADPLAADDAAGKVAGLIARQLERYLEDRYAGRAALTGD